MRRKLFVGAMAQYLAILIFGHFKINQGILISLLILIIYILVRNAINLDGVTKKLIFIFFIFGMISVTITNYNLPELEKLICKNYQWFNGRIVTIIPKEDNLNLIVETVDMQGKKIKALVNYSGLDKDKICENHNVSMLCRFELPNKASNPRQFDYREFLKNKGILLVGKCSCIEIKGSVSRFSKLKIKLFRSKRLFLSQIPSEKGIRNLVAGILFGEKQGIDEAVFNSFKINATAHILAVSGLHIGILFLAYKKIYRAFPNLIISIAFAMLLVSYGMISNWTSSVSRAVIISLISMFAPHFNRPTDFLTSIGISSIVILSINPLQAFEQGFQMSFLAVIAIAIIYPVIREFVMDSIAIMLSVQIILSGYLAYFFNYISLGGLILNLPTIAIASILVPLGIANYIVCVMGLNFEWISKTIWGLGFAVRQLNVFASENLNLGMVVASPKLWIIVFFILMILFLFSEGFFVSIARRNIKKISGLLAIIVFISGGFYIADYNKMDSARFIFVDVGQGDCTHIKFKNEHWLIDGGGRRNFNVGEKVLKPYFLKNGTTKLELAAITHWDEDHYLGISQLSKVFNIASFQSDGMQGDMIAGKHLKAHILWPIKENNSSNSKINSKENENSRVYMVESGKIKTLITGDISSEVEDKLVDLYGKNLHADVLKISHHGSRYSSGSKFIEAVNPKVAVICVGKNNYGHPSKEVIGRLENKGIQVYRTDINGAVGILENNSGIEVVKQK